MSRNVTNVDIGEYLYAHKETIDSKKSELENRYNKQIKDQMTSKKVNKSSEGMFEAKKNKKFMGIFNALDKNGNGLISADEIDIDRINPNLLTILNELLIEMEEKGKTLDCSAFCIGMSKF
jgi:hypothetical protein